MYNKFDGCTILTYHKESGGIDVFFIPEMSKKKDQGLARLGKGKKKGRGRRAGEA
jgi:hypothetical protein